MLRAARKAPNLLLDAGDRVVHYLRGQLNVDGGGNNRAGASDLYYTVFVLEGLLAMGVDPPVDVIRPYLTSFCNGANSSHPLDGLDFVHQTCLARCWAALPAEELDDDTADRIIKRIESHRSADGGYAPEVGAETGTVYHCFLAMGAYQDLEAETPEPVGLQHCISALQTGDGAYANEHDMKLGTTPATAAAATLMQELGVPVPTEVSDWLMARFHPDGGFLAMPEAPIPDLLSTATALHALAGMNVSLNDVSESCLDFVESLWTGACFRGHQIDDAGDSEYTYYALLALGHLSS